MNTISDAKRMAKSLRAALANRGTDVSHSESLELIATQFGFKDWNTTAAALAKQLRPAVPVLRIFSIAKATEFYIDYLGCAVGWEHRFEPGLPLYLQVSRSGLTLHLSEHHGDGTPGSVAWIPVADVYALHEELLARRYNGMQPGIDPDVPGGPTMNLIDPFGNVLRFCQQTG